MPVYKLYLNFLLVDILIEFGIPRKLVRLIKMCLNETYGKIRVGKCFPGEFPIQNGLKQADANHHCISTSL
jgi:hypothetical protein